MFEDRLLSVDGLLVPASSVNGKRCCADWKLYSRVLIVLVKGVAKVELGCASVDDPMPCQARTSNKLWETVRLLLRRYHT